MAPAAFCDPKDGSGEDTMTDAAVANVSHVRTVEQLATDLVRLATHLNVHEFKWLVLLAAYDARRGWESSGCRSCVDWIVANVGMGRRGARDRLRVARALTHLPVVCRSMAQGSLSFSKVRALTRVAKPETEAGLVELAQHNTAAEVERVVRSARDATAAPALGRETPQRFFYYHVTEDGSYTVRGRLPADVGKRFVRALEAATKAVESQDGWTARRADALWRLAESYLDSHRVVLTTVPPEARLPAPAHARGGVEGEDGLAEPVVPPVPSGETLRPCVDSMPLAAGARGP
jgi:hypothetical protein